MLEQLRADAAALLGVVPEGIAFLESATAALDALLSCWPVRAGDTIGVVAAEWGPNREAFARRGLTIVELGTDAGGRLDLAGLDQLLARAAPTLVHLTQVTSHRGLVQPVAEAAALCRAAGVPLWVDAAQALGHVDTAADADAVYATSRKWLSGPRGVGMLGIAERHWRHLHVARPAMAPAQLPAPAYLESHEAHVPGRVGLANALRELHADGPAAVYARLDEVGAMTREVLATVPGWSVVGAESAGGAITALRPVAGQDVHETRARLLDERGILTTAGSTARAPMDMREPLLRISPQVDCSVEALERIANELQNS